jgi:hypothetical protein
MLGLCTEGALSISGRNASLGHWKEGRKETKNETKKALILSGHSLYFIDRRLHIEIRVRSCRLCFKLLSELTLKNSPLTGRLCKVT